MLSAKVGQYFKWVGQSPEWVGHGLPGLGLEPPLYDTSLYDNSFMIIDTLSLHKGKCGGFA